MERISRKMRDIRFKSELNGKVMTVHSEDARTYARYLEEMDELVAYETGEELDPNRIRQLLRVDIRQDYFETEWRTDFVLQFRDGAKAVREIVRETLFEKRAEVEKMELSRRYWASVGVHNWRMIVIT